jgi:zinc/manganese transport system ATP-binding protein
MSIPAETAVILRDLTLTYERHPAVHHLSGALARGSLTAIVGPNRAGKSTLLKRIVGQMRPAEGAIERADLGRVGIGYLPQHAEIERRFPISVIDTVLLGHWRRIGWAAQPRPRQCARRRAGRSPPSVSTGSSAGRSRRFQPASSSASSSPA